MNKQIANWMANQIQKYARLSIVIVFYVFVTQLSAQTGTIKGSVVDAKTNEPLIGASVLIEGTNLGRAADLDGNFEIHNNSGRDAHSRDHLRCL